MLILKSPAKINLFLKILGRRSDGYHEIASLFQTINLFDDLSFSLSDKDDFTSSDSSLPIDSSNLVMKALELFRRRTGLIHPVSIKLTKNIPVEAGLGGGSSNAATTLWALNQLFGMPFNDNQLKILGAEIGSDVSFFLSKGTAYCTGRGEVILELDALAKQDVYIVKPAYGLSTPMVYKNLKINELAIFDPQKLLESFYLKNPILHNDLETPAFFLKPELAALKQTLLQSFASVLMSGSGTCFFCLGQGTFQAENHTSYACSFINRDENNWYSK